MGYSYYSPVMVYGFEDKHKDYNVLSRDYLSSNYVNVYSYAGEINKNYNIYPIIGITCSVTEEGNLLYLESDYDELKELIEKYQKYHNVTVTLGYFSAIRGDYEDEYTYDLDDGNEFATESKEKTD